MFLASRFVVVDDKPEHIKGIKDSLDALRYDCHTRLYEEETVGGWSVLPGIRMLFIDKNLRAGVTMGGGPQNAFAAIVEVIEKLISPESGPYGLVLWAEQPDYEAFKTFLYERLATDKPDLLPVFCEQLRKGDYINTTTGAVLDPPKLQADIIAKMSSSLQMKALFSWEEDVVAAMDAVLKSIVGLVAPNKRGSEEFGQELGKVLYRLSQAGSGVDRAQESPRESINQVLVPILADRITEHDPDGSQGDSWREALVVPTEKPAPVSVQSAVNSAIHLSHGRTGDGSTLKASDLGAVVEFPFNEVEKALEEQFGITKAIIMGENFFGMTDADWEASSLRLVQIGATCDHAQPKDGPIQFLLALEWAFPNIEGTRAAGSSLHAKKSPKSQEWCSPVIGVGDDRKPGRLSAFLSCTISVPRPAVGGWTVKYRLREELVSKLTQEYARHISRPGIVELR